MVDYRKLIASWDSLNIEIAGAIERLKFVLKPLFSGRIRELSPGDEELAGTLDESIYDSF